MWCQIAQHSIDQGDQLTLSLKKWPVKYTKVNLLEKRGAKVLERRSNQKSIIKRIVYRLFKYESHANEWRFIESELFGHVLISFGGAYDILNHKKLLHLLQNSKIKYSIVQQYNEENMFLSDFDRIELKYFFQKATSVFFVSDRNKITTERNLVCTLTNARVVSNPALKIQDLIKIKDYPTSRILKFACVARFDVGLKNQDLLIQALASESWKDRDFELSFYGKGPGEQYLKDLISFYDLDDKIKLKGHVEKISDVWKNHDCMILASSSEGSPLSIIEAMYASKPIIATNVGCNHELIDSTCGFIIPGVNIESIRETLEIVWSKRDELSEMGINSYKRISKIHDPFSFKEIYNCCKY